MIPENEMTEYMILHFIHFMWDSNFRAGGPLSPHARDSSKFLGFIIDNKLSWKEHNLCLSKTLSRNIGIINQLKMSFPNYILKSLYSTLILPHLTMAYLHEEILLITSWTNY